MPELEARVLKGNFGHLVWICGGLEERRPGVLRAWLRKQGRGERPEAFSGSEEELQCITECVDGELPLENRHGCA